MAETDGEGGDIEHTAVAGAPEQVSDTVPLKAPLDVRLRRYVAATPGVTVAEVELFDCAANARAGVALATVTVTDEEAAVPALSFATAVMVWLPFVVWAVFHDVEYGVDVI